MAHVAFPDERYNKHKLTTICRDGVWEAPHVNDNSFCGATVNGAAERRMYFTYMQIIKTHIIIQLNHNVCEFTIMVNYVFEMALIYHAALEYTLIMCFMDSRLWNAALSVFCRFVDASKLKSTI